jgi:hypothetical protein
MGQGFSMTGRYGHDVCGRQIRAPTRGRGTSFAFFLSGGVLQQRSPQTGFCRERQCGGGGSGARRRHRIGTGAHPGRWRSGRCPNSTRLRRCARLHNGLLQRERRSNVPSADASGAGRSGTRRQREYLRGSSRTCSEGRIHKRGTQDGENRARTTAWGYSDRRGGVADNREDDHRAPRSAERRVLANRLDTLTESDSPKSPHDPRLIPSASGYHQRSHRAA